MRTADIERLGSWLPDVADATDYLEWAGLEALTAPTGRPAILTNRECTAFVAFQLGSPEADAAQVDFLAVAPDERRLGIGGRVAVALERRLRAKAKRLYLLVPSSIGLALYFWLRLGYRPLTKEEWPEPTGNTPAVWMVRDI